MVPPSGIRFLSLINFQMWEIQHEEIKWGKAGKNLRNNLTKQPNSIFWAFVRSQRWCLVVFFMEP